MLRKITYFKEIDPKIKQNVDAAEFADFTWQMASEKPKDLTYLQY